MSPGPVKTMTPAYVGGFPSHGMVLCAKKIVDGEEKVASYTKCSLRLALPIVSYL